MSLTRGDFRPGNLFRRLSSRRKAPDDGGINGQWGADSEDVLPPDTVDRRRGDAGGSGGRLPPSYDVAAGMGRPEYEHISTAAATAPRGATLRGGGGSYEEFEDGDESYFSAQPRRGPRQPAEEESPSPTSAVAVTAAAASGALEPRPFHRTPTGLSAKQRRRAEDFEVNLEGGLEVRFNVEVNQKDPAGITAPYRLVVPRLWYQYQGEETAAAEKPPSGFRRLMSLTRGKSLSAKKPQAPPPGSRDGHDDYDDDDYDARHEQDEPKYRPQPQPQPQPQLQLQLQL